MPLIVVLSAQRPTTDTRSDLAADGSWLIGCVSARKQILANPEIHEEEDKQRHAPKCKHMGTSEGTSI